MIYDFESPPPPQMRCPVCRGLLSEGGDLGELECQYYHKRTGILVEMTVRFHNACVDKIGEDAIVQDAMTRAKQAVEEEWLRNNHPQRTQRASAAQYN